LRIVCFNACERWSCDATSDVADALAQRAGDSDDDISAVLEGFIAEKLHGGIRKLSYPCSVRANLHFEGMRELGSLLGRSTL
jgi:hypothetical protein